MNLRKYIPFILLILTLGCEKDDKKIEIETEKIVNGRILFSVDNQVPNNLKVLSLDGITQLDESSNLVLPSSINELEFLLTENNDIIFIRKKYPDAEDTMLSSESTILFLATYNSSYYKLSDSNKNIIISQIINNPSFTSAKAILDNSTIINLNDENFKQKIRELINTVFSEENLNALNRTQMPLEELTDIYTAFENTLSIKNNADIHVGFSITKDGNQIVSGLLDEQEQKDFIITETNSVYHIKSMSGADISGVFNDNEIEEIEAFNADFRQFLKESTLILLQLALPELVTECFEPVFTTAIEGIDFAEQYGNNNEPSDALIEAFIDLIPTIEEIIVDGVECVNQGNNNVLAEILQVFNIIDDIVNTANFLNSQLNTISQYIQYDNYEYDCYYKVENTFYECDNPNDVGSPTGPVPVNNATGVPINGIFSFSVGDNTPDYASFRVYTGLSENLTDFTVTNSSFNQYSNLLEGTTYYWKIEVINPATDQILATSNTWSFTTIGTSNTIPSLSTNSITNITETSASSGGNVTNDGGSNVTARGICWSTNPNPDINDNTTNNGTGTGTFTSSLTNLNPNTTYYVRAYATNSEGTAYGNQQTFTTNSNNNSTPTITTSSVTNVTETSASSGGNVTNDGNSSVTSRGICWSTNQNPTTNNSSTNNGTGTGTFTSSLANLNPSTTYYVRAYATNSEGTAYGNELNFTTTSNSGQPNIIITNQFEIDDDTSGGSNGNDNSIPEAGEDIELSVQIQNIGNATANNVSATLSTNDNDINITDFEENYGTITEGSTDWNTDFDFEIDSNCPTKTVDFTLNITSDEGNWQQNFSINVQGSSGGNPISITPTDLCDDAPTLQLNTEYEVNINTTNYGASTPIDGQSDGGNNVRGFWLEFNQPSGYIGDIEIQVYDVSSNFDPVIGTKISCGGIYYTQSNSSSYVANDNGYGGSETFTTYSGNNGYTERIRIYHYYGNETGNISFKIKIEEQ